MDATSSPTREAATAKPLPSQPARRVAFAIRHYGLDRKRVLDLGSGPGAHLKHFGPGSIGLDIGTENQARARANGLDVRPWNFDGDFPEGLGTFDAVWCSNLLEHVLAPHEFLIKIRNVLAPSGLLFAVVPADRHLDIGPWHGWAAVDHVNFFTRRTFQHTLEFAGFEALFVGTGAFPKLPKRLAALAGRVAPVLLGVGRAIPGFQYHPKAHKRLEDGRIVFVP